MSRMNNGGCRDCSKKAAIRTEISNQHNLYNTQQPTPYYGNYNNQQPTPNSRQAPQQRQQTIGIPRSRVHNMHNLQMLNSCKGNSYH